MKALLGSLMMAAALNTASSEIITREVAYPAGSVTAKGFLAAPGGGEKHPGVLVVHEWWGLNDYARKRATMLAELGYVALAVDMYGDGRTAEHPKDAGEFSKAVLSDMSEATARFEAALKFLQEQPEVDPEKIAAIGYCFGGGIVLQMAAGGVAGLDAAASFHGSLGGVEVAAGVKPSAKMLVLHGESDEFITPEAVDAFQKRMNEAGVELTFISYPGAKHGFTNPAADQNAAKYGIPLGYSFEADERSWSKLQEFLKAVFWPMDPNSPTPPASPAKGQ